MGDNDRVKDVIVVTERGGDQLSQIVKPPRARVAPTETDGPKRGRERERGNIAQQNEKGALWIIWLGLGEVFARSLKFLWDYLREWRDGSGSISFPEGPI